MTTTCGHTIAGLVRIAQTSDVVLYDGSGLSVPLPPSPSLNDVLEELDAAIAILAPTTTLTTADITVSALITGTAYNWPIGTSVQDVLNDISVYTDAQDVIISGKVSSSLHDAQTILAATVDNTPTARVIADDTLVGKVGAGNIGSVTMAQVTTLLDLFQKVPANNVLEPTQTSYHIAIGDTTDADKAIITVKDNAVFASNPYLGYLHSVSGEGFIAVSPSAIANEFTIAGIASSSKIYVDSIGVAAGATQAIHLLDVVAGVPHGWVINKAIPASRNFTIYYNNAGALTTYITLTTAGLFSLGATTAVNAILDESDMASNSHTALATQGSIVDYVTDSLLFEVGAGTHSIQTITADTGCLAAGDYAFAIGNTTTASANNSVAMGNATTASAVSSCALNMGTTASGVGSLASGTSSVASGNYSAAFNNSTASSPYSFSTGNSTASHDYSAALNISYAKEYCCHSSGRDSVAHLYASRSFSSGRFSIVGDCQKLDIHLKNITTDATASVDLLQGDGATAGIAIPTDCTAYIEIVISAVQTATAGAGTIGDSYVQKIKLGVKNIAGTLTLLTSSAATLANYSTVTGNILYEFPFTTTLAGTVVVSVAGTDVLVQVTGAANKTIEWNAYCSLVMTGYRNFSI